MLCPKVQKEVLRAVKARFGRNKWLRRLGWEECEGIANYTMVKVCSEKTGLPEEQLLRVLIRSCLNALTKEGHRQKTRDTYTEPLDGEDGGERLGAAMMVPSAADELEEGASAARRRERVNAALGKLPPYPQRLAIKAFVWGWSVREVAESEGVSRSQAGRDVAKAKEQLKAILG